MDASELACAVHGTTLAAWESISLCCSSFDHVVSTETRRLEKQGLSRMRRNHIHLASGRPGESGVISGQLEVAVRTCTYTERATGMRVSSQVLIFIDVVAAMAAGISFHTSANGVILTTGNNSGVIPPAYFSLVEKKADTSWESIPLPHDSSNSNTADEQSTA